MRTEEIIRSLNYTIKKHSNDIVGVGQTNISSMCKDILPKMEKLKAYEDAEEQGLLAKVVYGEWIFKNDGAYGKTRTYCSACGKRSGIGGIVTNQLKPYCPNCGAKMDIEQKLAEMGGKGVCNK